MTDGKSKEVLRETDADAIRLARTLLRSARHAALAVAEPESGWPLASRVSLATDMRGRPLILTSTLSAHTGALLRDPRCALLVGEPGKGDPLAHPRMTVKCRAVRIDREDEARPDIARRFLNRHPKAKLYADFTDFSYFRLEPESCSLNGGFARAYALTGEELLSDAHAADALAAGEQGVIDHMNADHRDAVALYAAHFADREQNRAWTLTGIDPDGIDLTAADETARIFFPAPLSDATGLRPALVAMARQARQDLS